VNIKRVIAAAIAVTIVGFIYSWITCGWLFNWVYTLEPINVWKPMGDMTTWMTWMNIGGFILNIILVGVFAYLYKGIPCKGIKKGLCFGLIVWLVGTLPGMFSTYMLMTVNTTFVIYWIFNSLVKYLLLGAVIAAIYKE